MNNFRDVLPLRKQSLRGVGLDLNDQGLRWVHLSCDRANGTVHPLRLEHCFFEPLSPGCVVGGEIIDFDEVELALRRLLAQMKALPGAAPVAVLALAVPDSLVTQQRLVRAVQLSETERLARVQLELAAILRCDAEDLCVDFKPARDAGTLGTELTLNAATVPKVAVEDRIALLEAAGLPQPAVMALASQAAVHAACRVMQASGVSPQAVVALFQLEPTALRLDIIRQGQVLHSHLFDSASSLSGWNDETAPVDVLQAIEAGHAEQLWVAGPAKEAGVRAATLRQQTALPCRVVDAFDAMVPVNQAPERPALRLNDGPEFLVACGLALTALMTLPAPRSFGFAKQAAEQLSFNFLPHREAAWVQRQRFFYKQLGAMALVVLLVSAAAQQILLAQVQTRQAMQAESAKDIAQAEAELKHRATLAADTSSLQRDTDALLTFMQAPHQTPLLLEEIRTLLPGGMHLIGLRRDARGDAVLAGQADSASEVFALIERLSQRSQHFKRPALLDLSLLPALPSMPGLPVSASGSDGPGGINGISRAGTERVAFSLQAYSR